MARHHPQRCFPAPNFLFAHSETRNRMQKHRSPARKRARSLLRHLGYAQNQSFEGAVPPIAKKPKSSGKSLQGDKRGGKAAGKRARMRADKPRRAGGGDIQAEPLPPPSRKIPGTDIPDQSRSEGANADNDLQETDRNMPNAFDDSPDKDMDRAGAPHVDPFRYPGTLNAPLPGGQRQPGINPFRRR